SGANASATARSHQDMSGANASATARSHQDMSGANASATARSHQTMTNHWKKDFPIPSAEDSYVTRREFTKFFGLTSVAFLFGTLATAGRTLAKRVLGQGSPSVAVANMGEVPVGGYKLFRYEKNDPGILLRLSEDKFVAFDQRCTHLSCPVVFDPPTRQLVCPCHAGYFSAEDGTPLAGPPKRALARLEVTTENAQVWVRRMKEGRI